MAYSASNKNLLPIPFNSKRFSSLFFKIPATVLTPFLPRMPSVFPDTPKSPILTFVQSSPLSDFFLAFEELNQSRWDMPKEKLLYIPEEIIMAFGGADLRIAPVYLFASDDRRLDELPSIRVNRVYPNALNFLLGERFEAKDGKYVVNLN